MSKAKRVSWNETAATADNARRHLPAILEAYYAQGREVLAGKANPPDWRAFRLSTERLRYTLELFRSCYGPGLRARMAMLQRLQQILDEVDDCGAAGRLVAEYSKKNSPQRARLRSLLAQRSLERMGECRRLWLQEFDVSGQERSWSVYLARHTRRPARKG